LVKKIKYLLFVFILFYKSVEAQKLSANFVDSLYNKAITEKKDTNQLIFLFTECSKITKKHPVETKLLLTKTLKLSSTYTDKKWAAKNKSLLGTLEYFAGNFTESESYYKTALEIYSQSNYLPGQAITFNNLASLYRDKGEYNIAIDYFIKSLKIKEELKDKKGIVNTLNNIANMHLMQSDNKGAEKYYNQAKTIAEEIKDSESLSMTYSNLANIYFDLNEIEKSYKYDTLALYYRKKTGDKAGIAISLHNISSYFETKKDFPKAIKYINESLKIKEEIGDKQGVAVSKSEKGNIYLNMRQPDSAIVLFLEALDIAKQLSTKKRISICYQNLANAYSNKNDFEKAYNYERMYSNLKDSLTKESYQKNISEMETKYDTDKKKKEIELLTKEAKLNHLILREKELESVSKAKEIELLNKENELALIQNEKNEFEISNKKIELENTQKEISLLNQKKEIQDLEIKNHEANIKEQKIISYFVITGFLLAIGLAFFIFKGLKNQRAANQIISHQKELVEEKHKEITDSINYAERIQRSFLATDELLNTHLKNYFVLFQPKDVVSGDFYWAATIQDSKFKTQDSFGKGKFILVTADSTGHGVPGAIMSILNISSLEKAVESGLTEPSEIFNHTRKTIIDRLKKDGSPEGGKDGMDASLVCFDFENLRMKYSAANNPVWIVRGSELIELSPDKMPVGKHDKDQIPFSQKEFTLQKGDLVYTLTDGLPDQFGGPKGKKFMYKQLKELLIANSTLEMNEQKQALQNALSNWKQTLEQVDDITLIGIKV